MPYGCKASLEVPVFLKTLKGDTTLTGNGLAEKIAKGGMLVASKPEISIISFTLTADSNNGEDIFSSEGVISSDGRTGVAIYK
jgi:hypothetical protein